MKSHLRKYLLSLLLLVISSSLLAKQTDTNEKVIDLKDGWLLNKNGKLELVTNPALGHKVIHFYLTQKIGLEGELLIQVPANSSFFIENKLMSYSKDDSTYVFNPENLLGEKHEVLVSIYGDDLSLENLKTAIIKSSIRETMPAVVRSTSPFKNYFIIIFLAGAFLVAILKNTAPNLSSEYFHLYRALSFRNREELIFKGKFFTEPNPLFYLVISFAASFLMISLFYLNPDSFNRGLPVQDFSFLQMLGIQLLFVIIFYLLTIVKWIIIKYFSELFKLGDFSGVHFFNYERYSLHSLLFLNALLVFVFVIFGETTKFYSIIIFLVVALATYRIILMLFKLLNASNYKIFHLFSYLCATEIIPYLIAVKLILI